MIELEGLEILEERLKKLGKIAGEKVMLKALRKGGKVITDAAKQNIAQHMQDTRRVRFNSRNIKAGSFNEFVLQIKPTKKFWFAHIFEAGAKPHTIAVKDKKILARGGEFFGRSVEHKGIKATGFFSKAFDNSASKAVNVFADVLRVEIDKAIEK